MNRFVGFAVVAVMMMVSYWAGTDSAVEAVDVIEVAPVLVEDIPQVEVPGVQVAAPPVCDEPARSVTRYRWVKKYGYGIFGNRYRWVRQSYQSSSGG